MGVGGVDHPMSAPLRATGGDGIADDVLRLAAGVDWLAPLPPRAHTALWRFTRGVKRALDIAVASLLAILLAPVLVVVAVLVVLGDGLPVLYPWRVVGHRGRTFMGYKFRTMVRHADRLKADLLHRNEMSGPVFKIREDPRVTRVGRWLRRYSLDELPQLWSVLKGDMSLVGPRPMFPHEFGECTPAQRAKLALTPGMTCLWQVSGRSDISEFDEWVELDLAYIRDWSLWLDVVILARTARAVVSGRGAR
jgi:lipopolysaccharide/colanic/teichoic acid biosynthesis glycosyltransferase